MSITINQPLNINGVISTDKSVLQNLTELATASGCWLTYDISEGRWSVVINRTTTSAASFNDSNIIGGINVSGTGVKDLYNSVSIEFPHKDLRDEKDYIDLEVPSGDRFPNEVDNRLNLTTDLINDPVAAQYIANMELKQSRLDKIIEFRTDFSKIGLKAGDIIDVTNSIYGYTNKLFRIVKIDESDAESLELSITALEFDSSIYVTSGLTRTERSKRSGILLKAMNPAVTASEDSAFSDSLTKMLLPLLGTGLLNLLFSKNPLTKKVEATVGGKLTEITVDSVTGDSEVCEGESVTFNVSICNIGCVKYDGVKVPYTITGVQSADIDKPLTGEITLDAGGNGSLTVAVQSDADSGSETMTFTCGGKSQAVTISDVKGFTYSVTPSSGTITEGSPVTFNITTTGIANGTSVPWTLTGATANVSPTSGNVTINNGSGTVTVNTTSQNSTSSAAFTIVLGGAGASCSPGKDSNKSTVTVSGSASSACNYVSIPIAWCGTFNSGGTLIGLTPSAYMSVLAAQTGGPSVSVPTAVTVSGGSVTISSTVNVDNTTGKGGVPVNVITSGFTSSNKVIKGTTTQLVGFLS